MKKVNWREVFKLLVLAILAAQRHYIENANPSDYVNFLIAEACIYWLHSRKM